MLDNEKRNRADLNRSYAVIFFDSFAEALADADKLKQRCHECDQLNVVIRQEGNMDDPQLLAIDPKIAVFAGVAWTTIHERRVEDGWYQATFARGRE